MALSMLRIGLQSGRLIASTVRLTPTCVMVEKHRGLVNKRFWEPPPLAPKPWPYETTKFTWFDALFEDTEDRFHENTRLIVVDGNIGVGKSTLAKKIAEEFDLLLFPEATMDMLLIDDEGEDIRSFDHLVPESTQAFDLARFYREPGSFLTPQFQYDMLAIRYEQYLDALAHILNTGQGVVMERSVFSDFVFMNAMHKAGYVNDYDLEIYGFMRRNAVQSEIFKPHMIIYLDAPIDVLQKRIKARGIPCEVNNNVLTDKYLKLIDDEYKNTFLPSMKDECEIVFLDWTEFGDTTEVLEDLERLPIEKIMDDKHDERFKDWKQRSPREWDHFRMMFTNEKYPMMRDIINVGRFNIPELHIPVEEIEAYNEVIETKSKLYSQGFNGNPSSYMFQAFSNYRDLSKLCYRTR